MADMIYTVEYTDKDYRTRTTTFCTEKEANDYTAVLDGRILKGLCHGYMMTPTRTDIEPGDRITAQGYTFTVGKILYQDFYPGDGFDVEFIDNFGGYHHWKQWADGGQVRRVNR